MLLVALDPLCDHLVEFLVVDSLLLELEVPQISLFKKSLLLLEHIVLQLLGPPALYVSSVVVHFLDEADLVADEILVLLCLVLGNSFLVLRSCFLEGIKALFLLIELLLKLFSLSLVEDFLHL